MRRTLFVIGLFSITSLCHAYGLMVEDHGVKVYEHIAVLPGGAPTHSLTVNGKSYHDLPSPFYLLIPEKGLVCFLTKTVVGGRHLVIVPTAGTASPTKVKLNKDVEGFGISLADKVAGPGPISVELIKDQRVFLVEKPTAGVVNHYCLDLDKATLVPVSSDMVPTK